MKATLTSKGQITIPHAIRKKLGLHPGAIKANQGDMPSFFAHTFESLRLAELTGDPVLIGTVHDTVIWSHALLGHSSPRRRKCTPERWSSSETIRERA